MAYGKGESLPERHYGSRANDVWLVIDDFL